MKVFKLAYNSPDQGWIHCEYLPFFAGGEFYLFIIQDRLYRGVDSNHQLLNRVLDEKLSKSNEVWPFRSGIHISTDRSRLNSLTRKGRFNYFKDNPYIEEFHSLYTHQGDYWTIHSPRPILDVLEYADKMEESYESCIEKLKEMDLMSLKDEYQALKWANSLLLDQKQYTYLMDDFIKEIRKQIKTK
jgi:hypothetical protein